jgi:hypothetical protein
MLTAGKAFASSPPTPVGSRSAPAFLSFLRTIEANISVDLDIHRVMDNSSTHKTQAVKNGLARPPRFPPHFTPTSVSWTNQVECWLAKITEKPIRRGTHRSTCQLEQAIRDDLAHYNENASPFIWTKSADPILASIEHFCLRIYNSEH